MKKISTRFSLLVIICLGVLILLGLYNDSKVSALDKGTYKEIIQRSFRHGEEKLR